jgi:O-antigen ligase
MKLTNSGDTTLDKAILFFIFLFLGSLSFSIFVNQIGYYGALILLLVKSFKEKKNPFKTNGLEIFLLLYITAEIAATVFSVSPGASFHNLLKRFLLLPIIYTISSAADDIKKAKFFLFTYLGFGLLSVVLYLGFSVRYYLLNLYQIEQSGPGIYQYPITTSELMSFMAVILFSFVLDEKEKLSARLWSLGGFLLTSAALLATYKRTGWLGAAAGILVVIILKRKWLLLAPIVIAAVLIAALEREKSEIIIYNAGANIEKTAEVNTAGRAYDAFTENGNLWLADYENGIVKYKDLKPVYKIQTPSPVEKLFNINDTLLLTGLVDTRFELYKKTENGEALSKISEFASPGFTIASCFNRKSFFVLDKDSGLTVFPDFTNSGKFVRLPGFAGYENMFCDSARLVLYSAKKGLAAYTLVDGLPGDNFINKNFSNDVSYVDYFNGSLLVEDKNSLRLFAFTGGKIIPAAENKNIKGVYQKELQDSVLCLMTNKGDIYKIQYPFTGSINIQEKYNAGFLPKSFEYKDGKLVVTKLKNSRIASIADPYNPSNFTRFALWSAGIKMFKDYPLFGVGDIDLAKLYIQYKHFYDKEIQGHLHNNYIHILVTLGLFGFIIVMALLIKLFVLNCKIAAALKNEPFASAYSAGVIGALVAFCVAGLTEWNFGDHEVITMVWFVTGLNIAFYNIYKNKIPASEK